MILDCIEVDEFKTGFRREGLYFGAIFFVQKILCACAMLGFGVYLRRIGYIADVAQKASSLFGIRIICGLAVAVLLVASIVLCLRMPMTRERHKALLESIRLKKEGKKYETSEISALL